MLPVTVDRAARRPLIALLVIAAIVGGWILWSRGGIGTDPGAGAIPGPSAGTGGVVASPIVTGLPSDGGSAATGAAATAGPSPTSGPTPTAAASGPATPRPGAPSATQELTALLDARLAQLRATTGIPGISAAIVFADGSIWRGTDGLADVAARRSVTPDTEFSVASASKTFTAALILALVEDGRLSLDATARSYLADLPIDPAITVRELLDHTSGLRDFFYHPNIDHALLSKPARVWDAARSLSFVRKPTTKPGAAWQYSNTNYLVLGLLAEAVGGAPVADQLRDRFFVPLGLGHTVYQASMRPTGPVARGYRFTGSDPKLPAIDLSDGTDVVPFTSVVTAAGAAGSIATSAGDLARWAAALYGGDALSQASRDAMIADIALTARFKPAVAYGLGVEAVKVAGWPTLGHAGRFLGARAVVRWLPDERIAIAVLTNQSRSDPNAVLADLLKLSLQPRPVCSGCSPSP